MEGTCRERQEGIIEKDRREGRMMEEMGGGRRGENNEGQGQGGENAVFSVIDIVTSTVSFML